MVSRSVMLPASIACFLLQSLLLLNSSRSDLNAELGESIFRTRGGHGCYWNEISTCPDSQGCVGTTCGDGAGAARCRIAGQEVVDNTWNILALDPPPPKTYKHNCGNTSAGTDGGCTPASYDCGKLETCKEWCSRGSALGSGFGPHTRYCVGMNNGISYKQGSEAWGGFCLPL